MTTRTLSRLRATTATLALSAFTATALVLPAGAPAQAAGDDFSTAQPGSFVTVPISEVLPTQPSLGYDEVFYKLGRFTLGKDAVNKKFADWCEAAGLADVASAQENARLDDPSTFTCTKTPETATEADEALAKTVVVGPGGKLYLTDGHHTLTSFAETPDGGLDTPVRLRVLGNLSNLGTQAFWDEMVAQKWTWLRDPEGKTITPAQLPQSVGLANFKNDKYRSLLYFARDIGYAQGSLPFQEFYWGAWLRDAAPIDLSGWNKDNWTSYLATVKSLSQKQTALADDAVIDSGFTATQLGKFAAWNDGKAEDKGEWAKLAKPYSDSKPGKLGYLIEYKSRVQSPLAPAKPSAVTSGKRVTVSWNTAAVDVTPASDFTVTLTPQSGAPIVKTGVNGWTLHHTFGNVPSGRYTATVSASNSVGESQVSAASETVTVAKGTLTSAKPRITGSAKVGKVLRANAGTWKPAGVKLSYQWLRNGKPIAGGTKSTYRVQKSDRGDRISVRVTGKLSDYVTKSHTSASVRIAKSK